MKELIILAAVLALAAASFGAINVGNASFDEGLSDAGSYGNTYSYDWSPWKTSGWSWLGNGFYTGAPAGDGWYVITANATWFQGLSATFTEGQTIDFSIDVGTYNNGAQSGDNWTIFLYDATVDPGVDYAAAPTSILTAVNGRLSDEAPPGGVWYNKTVLYTATAAEDGHAIGIGFAGDYYTLLDHASVAEAGAVKITSDPVDITVDETRTAVFSVEHVNGTSYEWRKVGTGVVDSGTTTSGQTITLTISGVTQADEGYYYCKVSKDNVPGGVGSAQAQLTVTALTCGDWGYLRSDINRDCYVNLLDVVELAAKWLNGTLQ
ncbi:MAG: immunoglobulin domain-containing protein [Planctomycetes bacterium]|nr:immunoglobulin domain-containing protein [Planctomycetota bacterium]